MLANREMVCLMLFCVSIPEVCRIFYVLFSANIRVSGRPLEWKEYRQQGRADYPADDKNRPPGFYKIEKLV